MAQRTARGFDQTLAAPLARQMPLRHIVSAGFNPGNKAFHHALRPRQFQQAPGNPASTPPPARATASG